MPERASALIDGGLAAERRDLGGEAFSGWLRRAWKEPAAPGWIFELLWQPTFRLVRGKGPER